MLQFVKSIGKSGLKVQRQPQQHYTPCTNPLRVSISSFTYDTRRVTLVNRSIFIKNAIIFNIIHDIINFCDTKVICILGRRPYASVCQANR
jgi:uracil DNA glycosylase